MKKLLILTILVVSASGRVLAGSLNSDLETTTVIGLALALAVLMTVTLYLLVKVLAIRKAATENKKSENAHLLIKTLDERAVDTLLIARGKSKVRSIPLMVLFALVGMPMTAAAQPGTNNGESLFAQYGIIITLILIAIPLIFAIVFLAHKVGKLFRRLEQKRNAKDAEQLADYLTQASDEEIDTTLQKRKTTLSYVPPSLVKSHTEGDDERGILNSINVSLSPNIIGEKTRQRVKQKAGMPHANLILWYFGTAIFWLLFGTTAGEYLGIKFVSPEADSISWLSFGRLRPVHTNAVFWGWTSLAMIGLAYYVVPTVSNTAIASIKKGWATLILINACVVAGSICLMAGINNGGGEYREYVWPVMGLFGAGLAITLINFLQTIARRRSREIYISNWYIVSALIFTLTIAFVAYWPTWQNGLGETIVQGYYMHQGVGMWFMLFTLGLVYYFLPQQVNKPIYSYGLGILAFWSQIVFYTLIGTHHFVFSSIPWWLQTVAIVGSAGMVIPVVAGTTNFFMTFNGSWNKLSSSYTLPFFFVGILFYFTGSLQGTAEAFRFTNLLWHFTDFTVAHSHLTMYGIVAFLLWGCIYVLVPKITGNEPSQLLTGIHFWMAFVGLMFYSIPLMIGGTLKGLSWMEGKFFVESITLMAPYWLWRAIGGTLMWISHIVFAFNFYKMVATRTSTDVKSLAIKIVQSRLTAVEA